MCVCNIQHSKGVCNGMCFHCTGYVETEYVDSYAPCVMFNGFTLVTDDVNSWLQHSSDAKYRLTLKFLKKDLFFRAETNMI